MMARTQVGRDLVGQPGLAAAAEQPTWWPKPACVRSRALRLRRSQSPNESSVSISGIEPLAYRHYPIVTIFVTICVTHLCEKCEIVLSQTPPGCLYHYNRAQPIGDHL